MNAQTRSTQTSERRQTMLRSACSGAVRAALEARDVTEILANPDGSIWIERAGLGVESANETLGAQARERIIRLVASSIGETCGRAHPIVSAELPGAGERFEGLLPPVAPAPCFAIRKAATAIFSLQDFVSQGALAPALADALRLRLAWRSSILIAGGTSSGKTTFANALLAEPALYNERIVILEDTRELRCEAPNVVALKTYREHTRLVDLVRSTMRLRPDRIVVGEVRGPEALDLLKAWNTGHPGGVATLHANSAAAALSRLEQLIGEATSVPPQGLIADAIDVVVFMARRGGVRCVEEAVRVTGRAGEGYALAPLIEPQLITQSQGDRHDSR